jgi:uncharacterized protein YlxP (DUF503 family)
MENLVVGVARFALRLAACRSLKEKRRVVRRVRDRLRARHNVAVAEIGEQDEPRKVVMALAVVGSDGRTVEASLRSILDSIEDMHLAPMVERKLQVETWGDDLAGPATDFPFDEF